MQMRCSINQILTKQKWSFEIHQSCQHLTHLLFIFLICRFSYQALYSYTPQNDDELELRDGDIVDVMEKCDDGWFVGKTVIMLFSLVVY